MYEKEKKGGGKAVGGVGVGDFFNVGEKGLSCNVRLQGRSGG